ncbi:MAG: LysR family transcriptional regulator [Bacteriovoracaceae bacterium]|jgi:DNA-binding transcriptional LysR family regulator|nr:LysR family transcriptional regulator [Bacteriovoracaceae bacterium]
MLPELSRHTEKLYYFYEVALAGSLHSASRKLGSSPPTISYAIKQLEGVVHSILFIRSKEGMTLTLSGEHLFSFCKKHFQELSDLEALLKKPEMEPVTRLKIGTFQSIAIYFWPYMLNVLKDEPSLSLSIMTNRSDAIINSLIKRDIDLAITVEGKQTPELIRHEIYKDEYCVYASNKFKYDRLTEKQVEELTLMYIPDAFDCDGLSLRQHLFMTNLNFKEIFEIDSFEVIAEFTKMDYGLGILPRKVAANYGSQLKEVQIRGTAKKRFGTHRFFLSYRNDLDISQSLMSLMLESAHEAVQQI